jgi:hypothetical protein
LTSTLENAQPPEADVMLTIEVVRITLVVVVLLLVTVAGLRVARSRHEGRAAATWNALDEAGPGTPFSASMVEGLPDPARSYLLRAIPLGAPLAASVEFSMTGTIRTSPGGDPMPLTAEQILSAHGLVWRARAGTGPMRIVGFDRYLDGEGEMRWWLAGLIPVASAGGPDVSRSAAGRVAGESVLLPPLLLPAAGARWEAIDEHRARVTRRLDLDDVTLTLTVDDEGRLTHVSLMRWREDAGAGEPGPVRFDVDFSGEFTEARYRIPAEMRAGWRLGAADEFAFFQARLDDVRYR